MLAINDKIKIFSRRVIYLDRSLALAEWVAETLGHHDFTLSPASSDASFRRYFRVAFENTTLIVMDAPPQQEDCAPYVKVAQLFLEAGVNVPKVFAKNLPQGFLLLSDLGPTTYLDALDTDNADDLYAAALDALIKIQTASRQNILADYDNGMLLREMELFPDWYIARSLQVKLSEAQRDLLTETFTMINRNVRAQGQVFVHKDYHSRNLMHTSPNPGILDFQDAVFGAITYDLVSLFKDAYISWEEPRIKAWCARYWEKAKALHLPVAPAFDSFYRDLEWTGVQRHLKVLGIFARLYYRDGKAVYLKDMPRVMQYLRTVCMRYTELHGLLDFLDSMEVSTALDATRQLDASPVAVVAEQGKA